MSPPAKKMKKDSEFPTDWDIDDYRTEYESEEHWQLRRRFMEVHKAKFPEDRLVCLAAVFTNMEFMGCKYPAETMRLVAEMGKEVVKDYRESRVNRLKRTFVAASDAAEARVKGRGNVQQQQQSGESHPIMPKRPAYSQHNIFEDLNYGTFVLYLHGGRNCIRLSAQRSNVEMEEKETNMDGTMRKIEIFVNKKMVASTCEENIKAAKSQAFLNALEVLQQECYTIKPNPLRDTIQINKTNNQVVCGVSKQESPGGLEDKKLDATNIGYKMMKSMGWTGGGLGANTQGREEPIGYLLKTNRAGLGNEVCKLDRRYFSQILKNYVESDDIRELQFEPTFTKDERAMLHEIAGKFNLKSTSHGKKDESRRLVISKKTISNEQILTEVLVKKNPIFSDIYFVQVPRSKARIYPEHTNKLELDEAGYTRSTDNNKDFVKNFCNDESKQILNKIFEDLEYGNFVLYLHGGPNCIRLSAHRSDIEFKERVTNMGDTERKAEIFLNGEMVASACGKNKKAAKSQAFRNAMEVLQQQCYTVKPNPLRDIIQIHKTNNQVVCSVSKKGSRYSLVDKKVDATNKGDNFMKIRGFSGDASVAYTQGREEPVTYLLKSNSDGLGNEVCKLDQSYFSQILKNYVESDDIRELHFEPTFTKDERAMLHEIAGKFNLKSTGHGKKVESRRLAISKKTISNEQILTEVLVKKNPIFSDIYFVQVPRSKAGLYPDHTKGISKSTGNNKHFVENFGNSESDQIQNKIFEGLRYGTFVLNLVGGRSCIRRSAKQSNIHFEERETYMGRSMRRIEIFLNTEMVASACEDNIKGAKLQAFLNALEVLQQECFTIKPNPLRDTIKIEKNYNQLVCSVSKHESPDGLNDEKLEATNKGDDFMKLWGFTGGGSVAYTQGREAFAYLLKDNRAGFENEVRKLDQGYFSQILKNYVESDEIRELQFEPTFTNDERAMLHEIAGKFDLKSTSHGKRDESRYIVISKKTISNDKLLSEILVKRNPIFAGTYLVQVPRSKARLYPEHTKKLESGDLI